MNHTEDDIDGAREYARAWLRGKGKLIRRRYLVDIVGNLHRAILEIDKLTARVAVLERSRSHDVH